MWLDRAYSIGVELIALIMGLPHSGINPAPYLCKDQDPMMVSKVKDKYDLVRANIGFLISSIDDNSVKFVAKVLSYKMLCKMRSTKCIT